MPELPEVHALVSDLRGRLVGHRVERLDIISFAALKTFDPPVTALAGQTVSTVDRHGKFLDLTVGGLHLIVHLARAGWLRWREGPPAPLTGTGKGPMAARLVMAGDSTIAEGSGLDITEAGTKKSLAIWLVREPSEVPGIARLGPDPLGATFDEAAFAHPRGSGTRTDQGCAA